MSEPPRKEIPRPKGDDDFEELALALYREVWRDVGAKLHGRSGQRQHGVDLYGEDRVGSSGLIGVQCKQHGSATVLTDKELVAELRDEVEKAKGFRPALRHRARHRLPRSPQPAEGRCPGLPRPGWMIRRRWGFVEFLTLEKKRGMGATRFRRGSKVPP